MKLNEDIRNCRAMTEVCDLICSRAGEMNEVNVATSFNTMAKLGCIHQQDNQKTAMIKTAVILALTNRALSLIKHF